MFVVCCRSSLDLFEGDFWGCSWDLVTSLSFLSCCKVGVYHSLRGGFCCQFGCYLHHIDMNSLVFVCFWRPGLLEAPRFHPVLLGFWGEKIENVDLFK